MCDLGLPEHPKAFPRGGELSPSALLDDPFYYIKPGKRMVGKSEKVSQGNCLSRLSAMGGRE